MSKGHELPVGDIVGSYRIEKTLGSGGFGITYQASHIVTRRRVALKELFLYDKDDRFCCRVDDGSVKFNMEEEADIVDWAKSKFEENTTILSSLSHPAIVRVDDYFLARNTAYQVMELIDGTDFRTVVKDRKKDKRVFEYGELGDIFDPIVDAVAYLHRKGIIHRDIAPDNIMLSSNRSPVLIDFGGLKNLGPQVTRPLPTGGSDMTMPIFKNGYSAPEMVMNTETITPATDIYSLGAVVFFALTGIAPTFGENSKNANKLAKILPADRFEQLLACLNDNPSDRPQNVEDLLGIWAPQPIPVSDPLAEIISHDDGRISPAERDEIGKSVQSAANDAVIEANLVSVLPDQSAHAQENAEPPADKPKAVMWTRRLDVEPQNEKVSTPAPSRPRLYASPKRVERASRKPSPQIVSHAGIGQKNIFNYIETALAFVAVIVVVGGLTVLLLGVIRWAHGEANNPAKPLAVLQKAGPPAVATASTGTNQSPLIKLPTPSENQVLAPPAALRSETATKPNPGIQPQTIPAPVQSPTSLIPPIIDPLALAETTEDQGDFMLQISSRHTDVEARHDLKAAIEKYRDFGVKTGDVQVADLGSRGILYRARLAGGTHEQAATLCEKIKWLNDDCIVEKH